MWRAGLSYESPYVPSIAILCDSPSPRASRPPAAAFVVSTWAASAMGCRGYVGTTEVPNSTPGTRAAATAIRVSASNPELCGSHTDENP